MHAAVFWLREAGSILRDPSATRAGREIAEAARLGEPIGELPFGRVRPRCRSRGARALLRRFCPSVGKAGAVASTELPPTGDDERQRKGGPLQIVLEGGGRDVEPAPAQALSDLLNGVPALLERDQACSTVPHQPARHQHRGESCYPAARHADLRRSTSGSARFLPQSSGRCRQDRRRSAQSRFSIRVPCRRKSDALEIKAREFRR